ncbi:MAG: serine hydrolase domain-containing protein [Bryobacterales bacterium]|nr:serine hydrolase domain-containing protein [Bryobacterales bacterium]
MRYFFVPIAPRLLAALLVAASLCLAQSLPPQLEERIDRLIATEMSRRGIPGLSVAIGIGDAPIWSRGYGFADLENFVPATERSRYRLASIAKPITAVALMQLVEAGKASLDDDVRGYVPDFPKKRWPITLRQLLGHLGGVRSYRGSETESTAHYANVRDGLTMFSTDPLEQQPGTRYHYSSYGFNLAGAAAESIAGKPFRQLLADSVFLPAGMRSTRDDDTFAIIPHRVEGYRKDEAGDVRNCALADTSNKVPGGGLIATAPDIVRFGRAVINGTLLRPESVAAMWTSQRTDDGKSTAYGLGWNLASFEGRRRVSHSGGQPGTSTFMDVLPDERIVVAVLTNLEGAQPKSISEEILRLFILEKAEE